jgi:YggT family protein
MIDTLIRAVNYLFRFLEYAIFIDVILSWVYRGKGNVFIDILHIFTEPFMAPARKLQQRFTSMSMLDFSPIIAYFILTVLRNIINYILLMLK